jgi:CBS domain-containing protein
MRLSSSVESVMRSPAVTVSFSETVSSVAQKMLAANIGAVIIVTGNVPTGIVTERDILRSVFKDHRNPDETLVQSVMSSPLVTIEADKSMLDALELMRDMNIRRLAVVRDDKLVGIVTERRLLASLV